MTGERHGPARWWRRRSLRARLTLVTSAGLALALAAAAVLLVNALRVSLIRGLDDSARQGAVEVAALIDQNRLPDPVPVAPGTITIQVLDAQGRITDVSPGADRLVPMLPPAQAQAAARTGQARMLPGPPLGLPSLLRVVAVGGERPPGRHRRGLLRPGGRQPRHAGQGPDHRNPAAVRPAGPGHLAGHRVHAAADRRAAPRRRRGDADRRAAGPAGAACPRRGAVARRHAERHALPAGRRAAAPAGPGIGYGARAAQPDRQHPRSARGRPGSPRRPGLAGDGARRARRHPAAGPADRGPAAARAARRTAPAPQAHRPVRGVRIGRGALQPRPGCRCGPTRRRRYPGPAWSRAIRTR